MIPFTMRICVYVNKIYTCMCWHAELHHFIAFLPKLQHKPSKNGLYKTYMDASAIIDNPHLHSYSNRAIFLVTKNDKGIWGPWSNLWNDAPRERRSQNLKASQSVKDVEYEQPLDMSFIHLLNAKVHTCVHVSINGDISIYIYVCIN